MEVVIRPFRPVDVEGLFVLDYRCYKPPYRFGYSQIVHTLADQHVTAVVIDDVAEHELIGGLILRTDVSTREATVVSLMVEREHRRQGLGLRLLQRAQAFVRTSDWWRLVVPLERGNAAGEALLRAGECRDTGVFDPFYGSAEEGGVWQWVPPVNEAAPKGVRAKPGMDNHDGPVTADETGEGEGGA